MAAGGFCFRWLAEHYGADGLTGVPLAILLVSAGAVLLLLSLPVLLGWAERPLLPPRRRRRVAPPREYVLEGNVAAEQPAFGERR